MPSYAGQGQGDYTEWKERGLGAAFYIGLKIANANRKNWMKYYHFDLNSGCGHNHLSGCIGSPLAFARAVADSGHNNVHAHFVDRDEESIVALSKLLPRKFCCHCGDNRDFITAIPYLIDSNPEYATGSILCDPNGINIPFAELAAVLNRYKRMDIIINWQSTTFLRVRNHPKINIDLPRIDDLPEMFGKRHWLIREPQSAHKFTLFIGRNIETGDYKRLGFHSMKKSYGKHLMHVCDTTKADRKFYSFPAPAAQLSLAL